MPTESEAAQTPSSAAPITDAPSTTAIVTSTDAALKAPAATAPAVVAEAPKAESTEDTPTTTKTDDTKETEKPVIYDLKLPENSPLDAAYLEQFTLFAKEKGLSPDQAQLALERESVAIQADRERQITQLKETTTQWYEHAKHDKEIGGDTFGKNAELAKRVVERFGTPEFKQALDQTGLGNHPELLRVFVRIGKAMDEDALVIQGSQATKSKSLEEIFYGAKAHA